MEPRQVQPRLQSVDILPSHEAAFFSTVLPSASSSLSISGGFQSSYGTATLSTHAPLVAAARTPPPAIKPLSSSPPPPPSSSSSQLLREIRKTGELLRTFRSLKERGASRAELADFHARVKALKAGQQRRERLDVSTQSDSTPPVVTSIAHLERQAPATTVALLSLAGQRAASSPTRHHGDGLYCEGPPMGSSGSSHARGLHQHHRQRSRDVCLDPAVPPSTTVCLSTIPAQPYTPIPNGRGEKASSGGNAGALSPATLCPSAAAPMGSSLVSLNSIVFAVVLAEAHMRREIMHRWERRWLRHWANFKERRVVIALRPPTFSATAAPDFSHPAPSVRWAESPSISLPCEHLQRQQAALAPIEETQGVGSAATTTGTHAIRVNPQPVLGWSIENERPTSTKRVVAECLEGMPPISLVFSSSDKLSHVAEAQQVTILSPGNTPHQAATHGRARSESPKHQEDLFAQTSERACEVGQWVPANPALREEAGTDASTALPLPHAEALAAAAGELAAALRRVGNDEGSAREAIEGAALEELERVRCGAAAARRRAGEIQTAMQSLLPTETEARVIIEGDEHRWRAAHLLAELEDVQRALLFAAAAVERRGMEEERALQEAAARAAALKSEEEREAAARRAAERAALESQLLTSADAEATERRAIEQQWQADLRYSEALLAEWIRDAAAAAPRRSQSTDIPNSSRASSVATATEDVASMSVIEAQALLTAKQEAAKRDMVAFRATIEAVLNEWIHAAATDAAARQRQADQAAAAAAAVAEAASQRREEKVAAQAEAMMRERAAVMGAEHEGRAALVCCEEEACARLQRECAVSMEELLFAVEEQARRCAQQVAATKDKEFVARLEVETEMMRELVRFRRMEEVTRSLEEEKAVAARHRLERAVVNAQNAASVRATVFCTAAADLSERFVDCVLAEAAQQASAQQAAVALAAQNRLLLLEAQSRQRGDVQADEAAARSYLYGELLDELRRVTREAFAVASKPIEAEAVIAAEASEHHGLSSQQRQRAPATALCFSLLNLSESLMLEFLRDAAAKVAVTGAGAGAGAMAASALGLAKCSPPEAPPDRRVTVVGDVKEPSDTSAEETHVGAMDIPEEESVKTAVDAMVGTPSLPLSRSSSVNAAPGAKAGGVSHCHAEELWRLPSPTVFVRLADGLLADLLREVSQEAPAGNESAGDTLGEARASLRNATQTIAQCRSPSPDGSTTPAVTQDAHLPDSASRGVATPARSLSSLTLPSSVQINTVFAATATDAGGNDGLRVQCAESEGEDAAEGAEGDTRVSNAPQGFADDTSTTTAWTTLGACVGGEGVADVSAGATAPLPSSLHCLSATSSGGDGDGDEDAAYSPLTVPEAPLPLNLQQHRLLSPLLLQQGADTSRMGDGCDEAAALSGHGDGGVEGAPTSTETPVVLVTGDTSQEHSIARRGPHRSSLTGDDNNTTCGADEVLSDIGPTSGSASNVAEDLRGFRLDKPTSHLSSLRSVAEPRADATAAPTTISLVDTLATVATSLVEQAVYEAALLAAPRGSSAELIAGSERETACDVVKADLSPSPHPSPSAATSKEPSATEGGKHHREGDSCMPGANSSSSSHEGDVGDELMAAHVTEIGPDSVSVGARETTTLHTCPSASPAAAAEGVSGTHTPLAGLSILASAIVKPNPLSTELRQQQVDKRTAAHHQNRFLTNREVALVAARYVTSEAAVAHVQQAGPTRTLSARVVALVLSVGLVHAVTRENKEARRRVQAAGGGSKRLTGGGGGNDGLPVGIRNEGHTVRNNHYKDLPSLSYTTGRYGDGGPLDTFGPTTPNAEDNTTQTRGVVGPLSNTVDGPASPLTPKSRNIRGTGMDGDSAGVLGSLSPSQIAFPSFEVATKSKASDLGEGLPTSNQAHQQTIVSRKLPSDWVTALRGVAERVAHDFIDYASRCFLLGHGDGQSNQDRLRTAQRIRDDALARVDLHSLFTRDLRLRDVARLTYYYVELAANGPRDRADPNCSPVSFGERNIFGRRSSGDMDLAVPVSEMCNFSTCNREDGRSQDQRYTIPKSALAPSARLQPSSHLSPPLHSRNDSLLSAATAVHIRRAGLVQLVLEQCVSNVVHDLVGDTVGWLGTIYQQSAPQPGSR